MVASIAQLGILAADAEEHGYSLASDLPFWGIVAFICFLVAIHKLGWNSLTSGMQAREANERRLIADAESLRKQANEQLTEHRGIMEALDEEVGEVLAEAQRDAEHTRGDIRGVAEREAETARERARVEIRRVKDQSLNDVFEQVAHRVVQLTEDKLRSRLTPSDQDQLIDAALNEFSHNTRPQTA